MKKMKTMMREIDLLRLFAFAVLTSVLVFVAVQVRAQDQEVDDSDGGDETVEAQKAYLIKDVKTVSNDEAFEVSFVLDRPYQGEDLPIDFIHSTIQVNIPNSKWVDGRKRSNAVRDEAIQRVVTFQRPSGEVRTQLILRKGFTAKQMESRVRIVRDANSLVVKVEHEPASVARKIESLPVVAPVAIDSAPAMTLDDKIQVAANEIGQAKAPEEAATPAAVMAGTESIEAVKKESEIPLAPIEHKKSSDPQPLQRMLIALGLTLGMGLSIIYALRKYRRRNDGHVEATKIKILNQHHLGPKKSLAIIRVAGESMLIGITDHNISMIKSLALLDEELPDVLPAHFANELINLPAYNERPDEFSVRGLGEIKSLVSQKLKDMRTYE